MSKTKMMLAAIGGVIGVAVLAAAAFVFIELSAKTAAYEGDDEGAKGLETVQEEVEQLSRKSVYPCVESVNLLDASREEVLVWKDDAFKFAARGDRPIVEMSPAQFKEFVSSEAKRLSLLPADTTNKMMTAAFEFGPFKPYIDEGKMPDQPEVKKLQRMFDDAELLIETCLQAGVAHVSRIDVKASAGAEPKEEAAPKKGGRRGSSAAAKKTVETFKPESHTYELVGKVTPAAFVKLLNAFATAQRFVVVEDFKLTPERDAVLAAFGGEKKGAEATSGRRRRRQQVVEEEKPADGEAPKVTVVTDPATDSVYDLVLTATVHDFKSLEEAKEEGEVEK